GLTAVADEDFVNVSRRNARSLERSLRCDCAELCGMHVPERSAVAADGRTRGTHDDDLGEGHNLSRITRIDARCRWAMSDDRWLQRPRGDLGSWDLGVNWALGFGSWALTTITE